MSIIKQTNQSVWNLETGITDLEIAWQKLVASDLPSIHSIWREQRTRLQGTRQLTEFTERMSREWAIETGILENLYQLDRGITQTLIERGFQAELLTHGSTDRPTGYVINLLRDQKDALDGVFDFVAQRRPLSTSYIKELHAALVRSQPTTEAQDPHGRFVEVPLIKGDWKMQPNFPTRDGVTFTYCPPEHVSSEMDRLVELHLKHTAESIPAEVEAAWLHHRFSQIHPFQDGNGRVARALASLILMRAELFPLVVTRDEKSDYLDSLAAADAADLAPLVSLVAKLQRVQFRKATALSENILAAGANLKAVLGNLLKAADKSRQTREQDHRKVFQHARKLEENTTQFLESLTDGVQQALIRANPSGAAFVSRSNEQNSHFYRAQIIENAKHHLQYYADTHSYRSWVNLSMTWERKARLVFAFHGIGRPFTGSLVCAPFFEFRDNDDESQPHFTIAPVTDEAFVFFYNESFNQILTRFETWREKVVVIALKELTDNL